ncbi:thaumatin family protein [Hypoxylon rubiginosum]|uniref:Thaumatin family protein n=1 Tax=Hypoxylon rubiginosum TaxID=110542 RepID=A0ACC0D795_9PEZI|nr:thaumatin family protein [Hypoxylon rubiginosum]
MHQTPTQAGRRRNSTSNKLSLIATLLLSSLAPGVKAIVYPSNHELYRFDYLGPNKQYLGTSRPLTKRENAIPLIVTNNCGETLWPGISSQHGDPPESHGFELAPGETKRQTVGPTWQGRIWGRTNCTVSGDTATCLTGDCFGKLDCEYGGAIPVTLAEFNLAGGVTGMQTFYDISLVDGYNLPIGVVYHPADNTSYIPPNLVNPSCIGTTGYLAAFSKTGLTYTNATYPMPYEDTTSNSDLIRWCPWDLQAFPPLKPGDGVYPYPDDNVQRPAFDPCRSACAAEHDPADCCTGKYDDPWVCAPSQYSNNAKAVCPDAYSYAFDDQTSTFVIPSGGGWEVVFCPAGRSTNILATFADELHSVAAGGRLAQDVLAKTMNLSYIESKISGAAADASVSVAGLVVSVAVVIGVVLGQV